MDSDENSARAGNAGARHAYHGVYGVPPGFEDLPPSPPAPACETPVGQGAPSLVTPALAPESAASAPLAPAAAPASRAARVMPQQLTFLTPTGEEEPTRRTPPPAPEVPRRDVLGSSVITEEGAGADAAGGRGGGARRESDAEMAARLQREMEESERLARQLMAEEAMEAYAMARNTLLQNAGQYSEEDLRMLRAVMAEEAGGAEEEEEGEEGSSQMDYESLLQLGEVIGDVKAERWKGRADALIDALPVESYEPSMSEPPTYFNTKCAVCQCNYEQSERVRILPCRCFFHQECVDEWLKRKDTCPNCKASIDPEARAAGAAGAAARDDGGAEETKGAD